MYVLTHATLGVLAYESVNKKKWLYKVKKPVFLAAVAGSIIPDIDVLFSKFAGDETYLLWHRGITHSLFVIPALTAIIWLLASVFTKVWSLKIFCAAGLGVCSHLFFDYLNQWGTGLLEPFSHARFSLGIIAFSDYIIWIIMIISAASSIRARIPVHLVFKSAWILIFVYISLQTVQGYALYNNTESFYDKQLLSARAIPGTFEIIGRKDNVVDILHVSIWRKTVMQNRFISSEDADLDKLFAENPNARVLYEWAPIAVIVNNDRELGVFDPRFIEDNKTFRRYEYIEK